jgi:hypothetical protein
MASSPGGNPLFGNIFSFSSFLCCEGSDGDVFSLAVDARFFHTTTDNFKIRLNHQYRINTFDTIAERYLSLLQAIYVEIYYRNRAGSFTLRPERSGSRIGLFEAFRMRNSCTAEFIPVPVKR